jgi:hypothetical protein
MVSLARASSFFNSLEEEELRDLLAIELICLSAVRTEAETSLPQDEVSTVCNIQACTHQQMARRV